MTVDDCFELGYIVKTHGVKGDLVAHLDTDNPQYYKNMESVFLEDKGSLIPFFVSSIKVKGQEAFLHFDECDNVDDASQWVGKAVFLPLNQLPPLEKGQFYYHDIIGFQAVDAVEGELGKVTGVYSLPAQDTLAIDYQGKEVLVPITDDIFTSVDFDAQNVHLNLPEGLLAIYLES